MHQVNIVFTPGAGLAGFITRWWTWGDVGHCAFETFVTSLHLCRSYVDAQAEHGVTEHSGLSPVLHRYAVDCDPGVAERALNWARGQIGKPYDWDAVLGMPFRRDWRNPEAWFCSDLILAAFEAVGFPLLRAAEIDRITPRDLMLSERLIPREQTAKSCKEYA